MVHLPEYGEPYLLDEIVTVCKNSAHGKLEVRSLLASVFLDVVNDDGRTVGGGYVGEVLVDFKL